MRQTGIITNWIDDKGFGFITPSQGGEQVFVHVTAFEPVRNRPTVNSHVTYVLKSDSRGRLRAEQVQYVEQNPGKSTTLWRRTVAIAVPLAFLGGVSVLSLTGKLAHEIMWLYGLASTAAFLLYAKDKAAARKNRRRTPEKRLHLLALVGGWPGAWVAQQLLRHKSRKPEFRAIFWVTVVLNCGAFAWALSPEGAAALKTTLDAIDAQWLRHAMIELAG
ncbi:hypothetical protein BJI67_11835 [Acidihalobacter aeolianus]|uniref:CSD domain-containing protein n=1 Tax=Acidihalobacter aeolianus TaxID=2792603 RepID=A0A1D8K9K5_9GAMM|nr:DUF1294 domain-containing protein [Acidihalobacter aeolianus]AOV17658.1 hypothetical protein BJI67_11835 [Acidihalobacter aeolianus]